LICKAGGLSPLLCGALPGNKECQNGFTDLAELTTNFVRPRIAVPAVVIGLSLLVVVIVILGELHLSGSALAVQQRPLTPIARFGLILWCLLWFSGLLAFVLTLSARVAFSLTTTIAAALAILALSIAKFSYLNNKLMFIDLYYSLRDWSEFEFLFAHYGELVVGAAAFLGLGVLLLTLLWRREPPLPRIRIKAAIAALAAVFSVGLVDAYVMPYGFKANAFWRAQRDERFFSDLFLSAQFLSQMLRAPLDLPHATKPDPRLEADLDRMQAAQPAAGAAKPPHIIAILHESSVDPAIYFDGLRYPVPSSFFASGDGVRRRLIVNTYGGGTWMSEHGLLLGLDLDLLPGVGGYLGMIAAGKFQNTLVDALHANGYRATANYPSALSFQNTDRFYRSIGFDDVFSLQDMTGTRDRDYYAFALDRLQKSLDESPQRPTFQFLWTAATHYPYKQPAFPDVRADEVVAGDQPGEFARRQRIAADDLAWLEKSLAERFPDEKFLIVGFGDHHPKITDGYFTGSDEFRFRQRDPGETRHKTYFRVAGINFAPDFSALSDTSSIGYLGEMIVGAARLPAPRAMLVRRWLRTHCAGLWSACADQQAVLSANRMLMSGDTALIKSEIGTR
jgi:phosphoglycerol transferase MdoB-like AlkP superfamily enzyme